MLPSIYTLVYFSYCTEIRTCRCNVVILISIKNFFPYCRDEVQLSKYSHKLASYSYSYTIKSKHTRIICDQAWEIGLIYTKYTVCIQVHISCSVGVIQHLLVLLNFSWISAYMMTFCIQHGMQIKSYYILNSQNQVKFYAQIRLVFPGLVTFKNYEFKKGSRDQSLL